MNWRSLVFSGTLMSLIGWLVISLAAYFLTETLWFQEVGYLPAFLVRLTTQGVLGILTLVITLGYCFSNLALANHLKTPSPITVTPRLGFSGLLAIVSSLIILLGLMVIHYGQVAAHYWHPNLQVPQVSPLLPQLFTLETAAQLLRQLPENPWHLGVISGIALAVIVNPRFWLNGIALGISLALSLVLSSHWTNVLQLFHPISFDKIDPLFHQNLSFYVFTLPMGELVIFGLIGTFLYGLLSCTLVYLMSGNSLSQGEFLGFSRSQQRHLQALGGTLMLTVAFQYWLARYKLLYSIRGVTYGASYTDVVVQLPAYTLLAGVAVIIAIFLFFLAASQTGTPPQKPEKNSPSLNFLPKPSSLRETIPLNVVSQIPKKRYSLRVIFGSYLALAVMTSAVIPTLVQSVIVEPNELARERPYIKRSIEFTQHAFGLDDIEIQTFAPEDKLTFNDLQKNELTIKNIRLWDTKPLLQTNRQLQQIRPYYEFRGADIDRYTLLKEKPQNQTQKTEAQQVIIAARELNYASVPQAAQTWVNKHLVYTHGYGFTLSPVNTVGSGGLPEYFVKNIGTEVKIGRDSTLETSSELIRQSIPIGNPRIYYGEISDTDIMTGTRVQEFDYPSGEENVYNTYNGSGGIKISSGFRRLLFAYYRQNWQMIFTRNFTPKTKLLFRRNINQRVRAIAPFLRFDSDPYLVVADANFQQKDGKDGKKQQSPASESNYLYWIMDAYTTSDHYPYSDPEKNQFNYIRNSVKVVIDAYNGTVDFYVVNPQDPMIASWQGIFPQMFKSLDEMPISLRRHIRYPVDLFSVQSERLLAYHMEDPQVFYNREDLWRVPVEIYGREQQQVEPYYLIMKLPEEPSEEFILLLPFTPVSRNNLIAWLAARSDSKQYGKLLLYQFPKQRLIFGPEQIEALINQVPEISQQISLWNRQGSQAVQGNLLVIPIQQSLLYIEPIYLEASQNSLPTLARVIASYENRIVMLPTLEAALKSVFEAQPKSESILAPLKMP